MINEDYIEYTFWHRINYFAYEKTRFSFKKPIIQILSTSFGFYLLHITINKICNHFDNNCQIGLFTKQYLLNSITKGTVCNSTYHISPCILFKILFLHCKIYQQTWVLNRQQYFQFFPILLSNHKIVKWDNYN